MVSFGIEMSQNLECMNFTPYSMGTKNKPYMITLCTNPVPSVAIDTKSSIYGVARLLPPPSHKEGHFYIYECLGLIFGQCLND